MSISCGKAIASHFISTGKGPVFIGGPMDERFLHPMKFDPGLDVFREAPEQKKALRRVASMAGGLVFVATHAGIVIGYVTVHPPDEHSRWKAHPKILELGAIEVSRAWRGRGIGKLLLRTLAEQDILEDRIVISMEYYWHWDMKGAGLDLQNYRLMLLKFFGACGFQNRWTDDPDIACHPANLFMVRAGGRITREDNLEFERLLVKKVLF